MAVPVLDTPKQKIDDQKSHSPHEFTEEERLKKKFGIELCIQILVSSECSSEDFVTVLRTYRGKYRYFRNNVVCSELKRVLMQYLPELRPEEVIDALDVVCKFKLLFRLPLIELLKFDIYRKITLVRDKRALLLLFTLIEKRKIKDTGIIEAYDLLVVAAETLTKHLHGN